MFASLVERVVPPAILPREGYFCISSSSRFMTMTSKEISGGVVHELPEDLQKALAADAAALAAWEDLTPLARNEWICWTTYVKKPETRRQHVERVRTELKEGMRRPCCWMGCIHRTDKSVSPSVQYVLNKRSKKSP
jgi:hypothetical protein